VCWELFARAMFFHSLPNTKIILNSQTKCLAPQFEATYSAINQLLEFSSVLETGESKEKRYVTRNFVCSKLGRLRLKCDGTRAETRFRLSAKRTSPFKSTGASVQSITGSRGVRISGSNAGYTNFRGSVKSTGYPLHSSVSLSLPIPCVTVCHHILTGLYHQCGVDT
jgi:hypothetical protein